MALYNTFKFTDKEFKDDKALLEHFKQLKESGVELELPVITPKGILSFTDYIIGNTSLLLYSNLLKQGLVKNSFAFKIENGQVIENENYSLNWMKNNLSTHKEIIIDAIEHLIVDLNHKHAHEFIGKTYSGKTYRVNHIPPLVHIITNIDNLKNRDNTKDKLWDFALTNNNGIKNYLKSVLNNNSKIREMLDWPINKKDLSLFGLERVLYHHELIDSYIQAFPNKATTLLFNSIVDNDLKDVKKLIPIYQKNDDFGARKNHEILGMARSPEMAIILMKNGFSFANYFPKNEYGDDYGYEKPLLNLSINREMDVNTIDTILSFKPSHVEIMRENSEIIFTEFFRPDSYLYRTKTPDFETMKLLIEKYKFPLQKFDMLKIGFELDKKNTYFSQWFLEHGANANNCADFISAIKNERKTTEIIDQYSSIMDINNPDFIYQMIKQSSSIRESDNEYCKELTSEQLLMQTSNGEHVWWALNPNSRRFTQFIHHGNVAEQLNKTLKTQNNSLLGDIFVNDKAESFLGVLEQYKKLFGLDENEKYPVIMKDDNERNILHCIFNDDVRSPVVDFVLKHTDADIEMLLNKPNDNGQTPLAQLLFEDEYKKEKPTWDRQSSRLYQIAKRVITHLKDDFPFESPINDKENAIDVIKELHDGDYDEYITGYLKNKLSKQLSSKDTQQPKKIKI